jgi:hypothetical protein
MQHNLKRKETPFWKQSIDDEGEDQLVDPPDLPSSFSAMEFQFWGPYFSTSCRSFSSSPGRQWPLGHNDGFPLPSEVLVVDDDTAAINRGWRE